MPENDSQLKKRFAELASRSYSRGCYTASDFLTTAEQSVLISTRLEPGCVFSLEGGYDAAERRMAWFGSEDICGYVQAPPIVCVRIAPAAQKFADALAHRDFLGALMSLGIKREMLGDIIVSENCGYLFCHESIAGYICDNLTSVRRTTVVCAVSDPPESASAPPEERQLVVSSERADAVISAVYKISRSRSQELFEHGIVFINSRTVTDASHDLKEGDVVSIRGTGRFIYNGIERETKKGRLRASVGVYL